MTTSRPCGRSAKPPLASQRTCAITLPSSPHTPTSYRRRYAVSGNHERDPMNMPVDELLAEIFARLDRIDRMLNVLLRAHGRRPDGSPLPIPATEPPASARES